MIVIIVIIVIIIIIVIAIVSNSNSVLHVPLAGEDDPLDVGGVALGAGHKVLQE